MPVFHSLDRATNRGTREAMIIQSTGYRRLDNVTLAYVMTFTYMPKPETIKQRDGEPTIVIRLGWGASQVKR
jgi:hypothetical protein